METSGKMSKLLSQRTAVITITTKKRQETGMGFHKNPEKHVTEEKLEWFTNCDKCSIYAKVNRGGLNVDIWTFFVVFHNFSSINLQLF